MSRKAAKPERRRCSLVPQGLRSGRGSTAATFVPERHRIEGLLLCWLTRRLTLFGQIEIRWQRALSRSASARNLLCHAMPYEANRHRIHSLPSLFASALHVVPTARGAAASCRVTPRKGNKGIGPDTLLQHSRHNNLLLYPLYRPQPSLRAAGLEPKMGSTLLSLPFHAHSWLATLSLTCTGEAGADVVRLVLHNKITDAGVVGARGWENGIVMWNGFCWSWDGFTDSRFRFRKLIQPTSAFKTNRNIIALALGSRLSRLSRRFLNSTCGRCYAATRLNYYCSRGPSLMPYIRRRWARETQHTRSIRQEGPVTCASCGVTSRTRPS